MADLALRMSFCTYLPTSKAATDVQQQTVLHPPLAERHTSRKHRHVTVKVRGSWAKTPPFHLRRWSHLCCTLPVSGVTTALLLKLASDGNVGRRCLSYLFCCVHPRVLKWTYRTPRSESEMKYYYCNLCRYYHVATLYNFPFLSIISIIWYGTRSAEYDEIRYRLHI